MAYTVEDLPLPAVLLAGPLSMSFTPNTFGIFRPAPLRTRLLAKDEKGRYIVVLP